jgi:hypothetical protein
MSSRSRSSSGPGSRTAGLCGRGFEIRQDSEHVWEWRFLIVLLLGIHILNWSLLWRRSCFFGWKGTWLFLESLHGISKQTVNRRLFQSVPRLLRKTVSFLYLSRSVNRPLFQSFEDILRWAFHSCRFYRS